MFIPFILGCISLVLYTLFGMVLMPDCITKDENGKRDEAVALLAPAVGMAVWQAISLFLGFWVPYNKLLLIVLFVAAGAFIFYKRKNLYFPKKIAISVFAAVTVLGSLLILWGAIPREMDGGIYFTPSAFDHQRTALINAIAAVGLPPLDPFVAPNGQPVGLLYHFGWHAVAAQYRILLGVNGITAGAAGLVLSCTVAVLTMGYTAYRFVRKNIVFGLVILFTATGSAVDVMKRLLPQTLQEALYPKNGLGFYPLYDNLTWSPHVIFAATVLIVILHFYVAYLKSSGKRETLYISLLLSMLAAGAATSNMYAGVCALVIFVLGLVPIYAFHKAFRQSFNRIFPYQLLCLFTAVLLILRYALHLMGGVSGKVLEFGVITGYEVSGIVDAVSCFFNFYLFALPVECDVFFLLGIIALLFWKAGQEDLFVLITKCYALLTLLAVFFVHSTTLANDFSWRTLMPINLLAISYAAAFFGNLLIRLNEQGKVFWKYGIVALFLSFPIIFSSEYICNVTVFDAGAEKHRIFAKAKEGWEVVRENTTYEDLVACNPKGFADFHPFAFSMNYFENYLFSFYADRLNYMADNHYAPNTAKILSADITNEELENEFNRLLDFFSGNPERGEVDYLVDECGVKALLVTPMDGLWDNPGGLKERYTREVDGDCYKVYLLK